MSDKFRIFNYILLLSHSRKKINIIMNKINKKHIIGDLDIEYHIFAYSQLLYLISERFKDKYGSEVTKKFFNKSNTYSKKINILANHLKHNNENIRPNLHLTVSNEKIKLDKIDYVKDSDKNESLLESINNSFFELIEFIKTNESIFEYEFNQIKNIKIKRKS